MRLIIHIASCLAALALTGDAVDTNLTKPHTSRQILPSTFKPPQVFRNVNLVRNINLDKGYPKETTNVVIENIGSGPEDEYYLPWEASIVGRVGGLEVRDKKNPDTGLFAVETVEYDTYSPTQFYRIKLPQALQPEDQQTLSITYFLLSALHPLPAQIAQADKQYLHHTFSAYYPSAYTTSKQKTKLKFPNADVPEYTIIPGGKDSNSENPEDPQKQGTSFTYGPYGEVPAGAVQPISVRYEFTKPVTHCSLLERDVEVSHWGGNLATEERYWLENRAAGLKDHFSRVQFAATQYYNPPTSALRELRMPLRVGSANPYFVDDIGNVSTSRFRSSAKEAMLELKPRYPVFGNWRYNFKVGWDQDLKGALRKVKGGEGYVLRIPFFEGPKQPEGIEYEKVQVRVILPEGAKNIQYETTIPVVSAETSIHRTFMDTHGRTMLKLTALNLVDEFRDQDLIITYDYPYSAGFRKPLTFLVAAFSVFGAAWLLTLVDVSIGRKKA